MPGLLAYPFMLWLVVFWCGFHPLLILFLKSLVWPVLLIALFGCILIIIVFLRLFHFALFELADELGRELEVLEFTNLSLECNDLLSNNRFDTPLSTFHE